MNMQLEDHLHRLADDVSAPASDEARHAVGRRTRVLRRRRQIRRTAGAGLLAAVVVFGAVALRQSLNSGDSEGGFSNRTGIPVDDGSLPAFTVDLRGWEVAQATFTPDMSFETVGNDVTLPLEGSLQVFRTSDVLYGPTFVVAHTPASDVVARQDGEVEVPLALGPAATGVGYLGELPNGFTLQFADPSGNDAHVRIRAYNVERDDLYQFAEGLDPKDASISYPPTADAQFGFEATDLPSLQDDAAPSDELLEEDPVDPLREIVDTRDLVLRRAEWSVTIGVNDHGEAWFEDRLIEANLGASQLADEVTVAGQQALRFPQRDGSVILLWRYNDQVNVQIRIEVDTDEVDQILGAIRQITEEEWQRIEDEASR